MTLIPENAPCWHLPYRPTEICGVLNIQGELGHDSKFHLNFPPLNPDCRSYRIVIQISFRISFQMSFQTITTTTNSIPFRQLKAEAGLGETAPNHLVRWTDSLMIS